VTLGRGGLAGDLNERAACQVRLNHVKRHEAKSKPCAQEGELGPEMGKTPHSRGQQPETTRSRQIRRIGVYELDVLGEDGRWNRRTVGCQRVLWRNDHGRPERQQPLPGELRWRNFQGRHHADRAAPVEHRLNHGARLDIELQQSGGEFLAERGHGGSEGRERKYNVHSYAQFRLKPTRHTFRPGLEEIYVARHSACIDEQCATLIGQHRKSSAAIEELHPKLPFQIRQRLAHHGLSPPQTAAGRREATFLGGSDEGAELVE
jgi:hypothetical protein